MKAADFMDGIFGYTRDLIEQSGTAQLDTDRLGDCPLCGREVMKGREAYGCSGWKEGCAFILQPRYKSLQLTPNQIQVLLQMHILPYPILIGDEQRLLLLSTQGELMDMELPSADRQKSVRTSDRAAKSSKTGTP